jgi:hypothetical protein
MGDAPSAAGVRTAPGVRTASGGRPRSEGEDTPGPASECASGEDASPAGSEEDAREQA